MMTGITSAISRRSVLESIAGVSSLLLAGCSGRGSADRSSGGGKVFEEVVVDGTALVVSLAGAASVEQVNVIQPDDELFATRDVPAGVGQVSFDLGTTYAPGEYRILALKDGETVAKTARGIRPELDVLRFGIGRNHPDKMWNGPKDEIAEEAFVDVKNTGTGPDAITKLLFFGDVPYPSSEEGTNYADDEDVSGIYDPETDREVAQVIVGPEETKTIYSSRSPFAFVPGSGITCSNEEQSGRFRLVLETRVGENRVSKAYNISYSASGADGDCEISISEVTHG